MRKWHIDAWRRGGCAACGTDTRDNGTIYAHFECADAFKDDDWKGMHAAISYSSKKPNPDHSALLLRAASFLADLPSGSLDRVRNVEAMNLIRALRDAVVPADKVRK